MQTLAIQFQEERYLKRTRPKVSFRREMLKMKDGGTVALDWSNYEDSKTDEERRKRPILAMIPGLSGDAYRSYTVSVIIEAEKYNYQPVVINYRGGGGFKITVNNYP